MTQPSNSRGLIEKLSELEDGRGCKRPDLQPPFVSIRRIGFESNLPSTIPLTSRKRRNITPPPPPSPVLFWEILCSQTKTIDLNTVGNSFMGMRSSARFQDTPNRVCQQMEKMESSFEIRFVGNDVWDVSFEGMEWISFAVCLFMCR